MPPAQRRGTSRQDYQTPPELVVAVEGLLRENFSLDLAATQRNKIQGSVHWLGPGSDIMENSLEADWTGLLADGIGWLNPPFKNILPWVGKAWVEAERGARVVMLVPAGVGTDWFRFHVHGKAQVLTLSPRLTFVGEVDPYPKDLMLLFYGWPWRGFDPWRWKP